MKRNLVKILKNVRNIVTSVYTERRRVCAIHYKCHQMDSYINGFARTKWSSVSIESQLRDQQLARLCPAWPESSRTYISDVSGLTMVKPDTKHRYLRLDEVKPKVRLTETAIGGGNSLLTGGGHHHWVVRSQLYCRQLPRTKRHFQHFLRSESAIAPCG